MRWFGESIANIALSLSHDVRISCNRYCVKAAFLYSLEQVNCELFSFWNVHLGDLKVCRAELANFLVARGRYCAQ